MSTKNPKLDLRFITPEITKELIVFEDNFLQLHAEIEWDGKKVKSMNFTSDAKGYIRYKIKGINLCEDENGTPFYMIHLYGHTDSRIPEPFTFPADNTQHIPNLTFENKYDFNIFRFNISRNDDAIENPCDFIDVQPETKDGAIIVSI